MTVWCLTTASVLALAGPAVIWQDDFESGLRRTWRVTSGAPKVVADPDGSGGHVLEMTPSSKAILRLDRPIRDAAIEARVRFAERRGWAELQIRYRR